MEVEYSFLCWIPSVATVLYCIFGCSENTAKSHNVQPVVKVVFIL